jgi:hypothetical protein
MAFEIKTVSANTGNGKIDPNNYANTLKSHQWKSIEISILDFDHTLWGAKAIEWSISVDTNIVKGLKDVTVINDTFNKVYTGSLTVLQSEIASWYRNINSLQGYSLVDFDSFDIKILTDDSYTILRGCKFTNDTRNYSQSSGEPEVTLNLSISKIEIENDPTKGSAQ